ncbi:MAG TPA: glycoside hydrolase family 3 N-terminal domain-containing protein [Actinomycetaceae bacterium]|nr:glycoside hydrolase family 3 N-terminal domain-containing protein [Actinomycetaceae bacterium]
MRISRTRSVRPAVVAAMAITLSLAMSACQGDAATETESPGEPTTAAQESPAAPDGAPTLGATVKEIIEVDGESFKDLNGSGELDAYEDWRLPADQRVADLVAAMTIEEKSGLMLIDTLNAECGGELGENAEDYLNTQQMRRFIFRNTVVEDATECEAATGLSGSVITAEEAATFMNAMQEAAEGSRLGIPVLYKSNARNHIDPLAVPGVNTAGGSMTAFPKEAGLAAAALGAQAANGAEPTDGDMSVIQEFAEVMGAEWSAIGLRGMYGYMADLSTEPRWYRTHETFTEDADLNANIMRTLVESLQGEMDEETGSSLSPDTDVALTLKHFPGGGPQELGLDPHYSFGKTQVYPGGAFGEHLKPFQAAIDAGVSSIMPYYGVPVDVTYEGVTFDETGMAFSEQIVTGLLRDQLGFEGYVNSDTGIIEDRAWGLEENTVPERVAAAINGGTDTLSGFHDLSTITNLVSEGLITEDRVNEAATSLLTPMFQMGLFENPYVDAAAANDAVGSDANAEIGLEMQRASQVLLQNNTDDSGAATLPMEAGATVYVLGNLPAESVEAYGFTVIDGNATPRPSAADADYLLVNMSARNDREATQQYTSRDYENHPVNPMVLEGVAGLDGESNFGETDACIAFGAEECTDDTLMFGGSLPWESDILDFTGMAEAESWEVVPGLDVVQEAMAEIGDPNKVILSIYFRQPYVLDEASGLRDAGAIVANFGASDTAMLDVLSGEYAPTGRMPFALAGTRQAIIDQDTDLPGYKETADGELFAYGFGLTYEE